MIDLLILNYNDADTTIDFINNVKGYSVVEHILVVDNCSTDNSYDRLKKLEDKKICVIAAPRNGGYGFGNNYGMHYLAREYRSQYVLQCNPDVIVNEKVLQSLEQFLITHPDYAIAAPFMLDKEGKKVPYAAFPLATKWQYILSLDIVLDKFLPLNVYEDLIEDTDSYKTVDAVAGSLLMYDLKKMMYIGMYDENIFLYCEEMSLGLKLKAAGYKTALLLHQTFIHNHSVSINKTYKSGFSKRKLLVKSKLYVIQHFYKASNIEYFIAYILSKLSFLEIILLDLYHNYKK